jgi:hypothetical protein
MSLLVAFGLSALVANPAIAVMPMPQPIDGLLRDEWRAPFEEFLQQLKVSDIGALVAKTSAFQIGGMWHEDWILFRIEDTKTCHEDMCLTIIGRIVDGKLTANAMFTAGKYFTRYDAAVPMFGFQVLPAFLAGSKISMTLFETPTGWMVAPTVTHKGAADILPEK